MMRHEKGGMRCVGLGLGKVGLAPLMGVEREEVKGWGIKDEGLRMKRRGTT